MSELKDYNLTILGCGVMGTAVLSAILSTSFDPYPKEIVCCTSSEKSALKLKSTYGDKIQTSYGAESNKEAVKKANVLILGCKPFLFKQIMDEVDIKEGPPTLIISLMAGWTIQQIKETTGCSEIARVMTNTPAKYACGTAAISFSESAAIYEDLVMKLIGNIGLAVQLPEKNMDAATALVGSGPAFCLLMLEALTDGGVKMGIPYAVAKQCAAKVMEGTAKMVLETGDHPAVLKSAVCTPGGTTIAGLMVMEDKGVRSGIARAVEEAANVATSLGKK
ncbi:hypothetical protein CANARDRAFT_6394 [[Candida] arabinofermentans NRRL YB-2248]|uniref:Pyrroline-5-carboxylate reductase n=1 Tax=[Candida] arabinofermentans NRRL YB-2248 TaxID=983967 RepID=A0A1E4T504_9ASCO|nr:hypothetical protein CANARDRAFT_6394 [[Candida] arabinofermentans NRRL YB-2248]